LIVQRVHLFPFGTAVDGRNNKVEQLVPQEAGGGMVR
jgi:hypothetical protein